MRPGRTTTEYRATVGSFIAAGAAIAAESFGVDIDPRVLELLTEAAFAAAVLYPLARGVAKRGAPGSGVESSEFRVAVVAVVGGLLTMLAGDRIPAELREFIGQGVAASLTSYIASRGLAKRPGPELVEPAPADLPEIPATAQVLGARRGGALEQIIERSRTGRSGAPP